MNNVQFHYSHAAPTIHSVEMLSKKLEIAIPSDFADYLVMVNGGSPDLPCFVYTGKRGSPKKGMLHWIFGITNEYRDSRSIERINESFIETDQAMRGRYLIIGYTDVGHLVLDCESNSLIVQNLNHSYGIPEGGFDKFITKSFSSFIASLTSDPKGRWKPLAPFGLG